MPVQREELLPVPRSVFEDHQRTVVERRRVVGERVNDSLDRRVDRRSRLDKQVEAQVDRAVLFKRAVAAEYRRRINGPRLIVSSHAYGGTAAGAAPDANCALGAVPFPFRGGYGMGGCEQTTEDRPGQRSRLQCVRVSAEKSASHTQIEHDAGVANVGVKHRVCIRRERTQPVPHAFVVRHRSQSAGVSENVMSETGMDIRPSFQSLPRWGLADGHVIIIGLDRLSMCRVDHAHRQTRRDERVQQGDFFLCERKCAMISGHQSSRGSKRLLLAEYRVRGGNRRLGHDHAPVHVAEIDESQRTRMRPCRTHQHVVVVRVGVDDAAPQTRQLRHNFASVLGQNSLHQLPAQTFWHILQVIANPRSARQVPLQFAVRSRMRKARQRGIQVAQDLTDARQQLPRVGLHLCQHGTGHVGQQPDEACRIVGQLHVARQLPVLRVAHARQPDMRRTALHMSQRLRLEIDPRQLASRMHDLEHVFAPSGVKVKVVVVFSGQSAGGCLKVVAFTGKPFGFTYGDRLGGTRLGHHVPDVNEELRLRSIAVRAIWQPPSGVVLQAVFVAPQWPAAGSLCRKIGEQDTPPIMAPALQKRRFQPQIFCSHLPRMSLESLLGFQSHRNRHLPWHLRG